MMLTPKLLEMMQMMNLLSLFFHIIMNYDIMIVMSSSQPAMISNILFLG